MSTVVSGGHKAQVHPLTASAVASAQQQPHQPGKENPMYGAPASAGYFGVQQPLPLHLAQQQQAQAQAHATAQFGMPIGKASSQQSSSGRRAASKPVPSGVSDDWKPRVVRAGSTSSVAGMAPAPPSVRELASHAQAHAHAAANLPSSSLLKEVAALRRAAATAAAATQQPSGPGLSVAGMAAAQQGSGASRKVPTPPESSRGSTRTGTSGAAAVGTNSQRRRATVAGSGVGSSATSAAAAAAVQQAQFDQFSLWNDLEPTPLEWAQRPSHQSNAGAGTGARAHHHGSTTHQLYPQPGTASSQQQSQHHASGFSRPDANFHHPSQHSQHRAVADAAAAARVESRTNYGAGSHHHGKGGAAGAAGYASGAAAAAAAGGLDSNLSSIDTTRANERVEKRFAYWKNFWSNIQAMRNKQGQGPMGIPLPDQEKVHHLGGGGGGGVDVGSPIQVGSSGRTGPAGFGMAIGGESSTASKAPPHTTTTNPAPDAAHLLGLSDADFRAAMAEFNELDISHSMDQTHTPVPATYAATTKSKQGPSPKKTAKPQTSSTAASTTAQGNPAAYAAFQQYQAQFESPSKATGQQQQSASTGRPTSASKQQQAATANANAAAALKREHEREKAAIKEAAAIKAAAAAAAAAIAIPAAAPAPSSTDATSASSTAAAAADAAAAAAAAERTRQSNVDRFWAEERSRAGKPRSHAGAPGGGSKAKVSSKAQKAALHFVAPPDTDAARDMWRNMKKDLDDKWNKFAGGATAAGDDKDEKAQAANTNAQSKPTTTTSRGGESTARATPAAAADAPRAAEGTSTTSPSSRRSTSYSFTNIRKEDLKYHAAPAAAAAPAPAAAATSARPSAAAAGAQFSSFTRPPQPHTSSSSSAHSAAHAAAVAAGMGTAFELYSRWSVKELRRELLGAGVSAGDLSRLVEKDEMVTRLLVAQQDAARKAEAKKAAEAVEQSREQLRDRIIQEVDRWAKGRNIKSMLNELNGFVSIDTPGYLKRTDTLVEVSKSYKKALLRIHPDKHMSAGGVHDSKYLRATEVFKYVSQAFDEYKKKHDK